MRQTTMFDCKMVMLHAETNLPFNATSNNENIPNVTFFSFTIFLDDT